MDAARGPPQSIDRWPVAAARRLSSDAEDSPSGLWRTLGKRVGFTPSRVRIPHPPPFDQQKRRAIPYGVRPASRFSSVPVPFAAAEPPDQAAHTLGHITPDGAGDVLTAAAIAVVDRMTKTAGNGPTEHRSTAARCAELSRCPATGHL